MIAGVSDDEILIGQHGALRRITLNRPKALNAITLNMAVIMTAKLKEWAADPAVGAVMIDGAGDRAFAAGGDIRALYDAAKAGDPLPEKFWAIEYHLDVLIARYPKPIVALADRLVMGGGVGLSAHAAHCILTDRSTVAMPEAGIGFFPDVGVSYLMTRAHWEVGTYVALTGSRLGAQDAFICGLGNCHIPASRVDELPVALAGCRTRQEVWGVLHGFETSPDKGRLLRQWDWIVRCFNADTVEEIMARLHQEKDPDATESLAIMRKASPTSLKITLRNLRDAARFTRVEQCFQQDYRIALACVAGPDLIEGIRATIVDKDRNPAWLPDTIEAVTPDIVDRHFQSVGALELHFD